jgi:O-antigen ligase
LIGAHAQRRQIRISVVLQIALLLLVIGNLGRIPVFSTAAGTRSVPLLVNDLVMLAIVAIGTAAVILKQRLHLDSVALFALAFAATGGLTAIAGLSRFDFTTGEVFIALAFLARWLLYFAAYVVTINCVRAIDVLAVWGALENCAVIFSAFGLLQAALLPNFAFMVYPDASAEDWDAQRHRLVSTFLDPNFAGALIMMVLLVQLSLISNGAPVKRWKLTVLGAALIVTLSRSSILGALLGLACIVLARGLSKRLARVAIIAATVFAASLPALIRFAGQYNKLSTSDASGLGRLILWAHEWTIITEHPIVGIGFNTWGAIIRQKNWVVVAASAFGQEGGLLFICALTGVVGLSLYIGMIVSMWLRSRAVWRDPAREPFERGITLALPALTVAMIFHSLFANSLLHPFLMEPLWILWGLGSVIAREPYGLASTGGGS